MTLCNKIDTFLKSVAPIAVEYCCAGYKPLILYTAMSNNTVFVLDMMADLPTQFSPVLTSNA